MYLRVSTGKEVNKIPSQKDDNIRNERMPNSRQSEIESAFAPKKEVKFQNNVFPNLWLARTHAAKRIVRSQKLT